jgi:hypothetical protein
MEEVRDHFEVLAEVTGTGALGEGREERGVTVVRDEGGEGTRPARSLRARARNAATRFDSVSPLVA